MSMAESALMGVDVGTTFIKALVCGEDLNPFGEAQVRTPWVATAFGSTEADPERLAQTALACVARAIDACTRTVRVRAVGVTGMGETGVLADAAGRPLAPAIAWHDARGSDEARNLAEALPSFAARAGRPPDERPSAVKWRWLATHGHDLRAARCWHSVPEWIAGRLGARPGSELSLASRTGALDVEAGSTYDEVIEWAGAAPGWLGELVPAGAPAGRVNAGPSELIGATVTVAGLDAYSSARALGADGPRTVLLSCGTSGATIRVPGDWPDVARAAAGGFTVDRHIDGQSAAVLGAIPCGLVLQPLRDRLGPPGDPPAAAWTDAYASVAADEARIVGALEALCGPIDRVVAGGGWIEHAGLQEALRAHLGEVVETRIDAMSAARGAALMARSCLSG